MCRIIPPKEGIFPYISILFRIETFHPSPFFFQDEAEKGDPVAQTLRAMRASSAEESWRWLKQAAESGFPRAQLYFGKAYEDGLVQKPQTQEAAEWFEKSRRNGEVDACFWDRIIIAFEFCKVKESYSCLINKNN